MVEDIVAEADAYGYEVVLGAVTPTHGESEVVDTLLDFRCEALILLGPELADAALAALGRKRRSSSSADVSRAPSIDVVRTADGRGIGKVVDHSSSWDSDGSAISAAEAAPFPTTAKPATCEP